MASCCVESPYRRALAKNYIILVSGIIPQTVLPHLIQNRILSLQEADAVYEEKGMDAQVRRILTLMDRKPDEMFPVFVRCLQDSDHEHIANVLDVKEETYLDTSILSDEGISSEEEDGHITLRATVEKVCINDSVQEETTPTNESFPVHDDLTPTPGCPVRLFTSCPCRRMEQEVHDIFILASKAMKEAMLRHEDYSRYKETISDCIKWLKDIHDIGCALCKVALGSVLLGFRCSDNSSLDGLWRAVTEGRISDELTNIFQACLANQEDDVRYRVIVRINAQEYARHWNYLKRINSMDGSRRLVEVYRYARAIIADKTNEHYHEFQRDLGYILSHYRTIIHTDIVDAPDWYGVVRALYQFYKLLYDEPSWMKAPRDPDLDLSARAAGPETVLLHQLRALVFYIARRRLGRPQSRDAAASRFPFSDERDVYRCKPLGTIIIKAADDEEGPRHWSSGIGSAAQTPDSLDSPGNTLDSLDSPKDVLDSLGSSTGDILDSPYSSGDVLDSLDSPEDTCYSWGSSGGRVDSFGSSGTGLDSLDDIIDALDAIGRAMDKHSS